MTAALPGIAARQRIAPGDIIVRRMNSFWGLIARAYETRQSRFSHMGLVVRQAGDRLAVLHADGAPSALGRIRVQDLEAFLEGATDWAVYRLRLPPEPRRAMADAGMAMLAAGVTFDGDFRIDTADAVYCTELVWRAARTATGIDIAPRKSHAQGQAYVAIGDIITGPEAELVLDARDFRQPDGRDETALIAGMTH